MPSSGSTTSRIASSTSASNSLSGAEVSLIFNLLDIFSRLRERIFKRHPAEQRTFDPGRILGDAGERDAVAQHILVAGHRSAGRHHLGEPGNGLQCLPNALTYHLLG